jgi:hypothetical protein
MPGGFRCLLPCEHGSLMPGGFRCLVPRQRGCLMPGGLRCLVPCERGSLMPGGFRCLVPRQQGSLMPGGLRCLGAFGRHGGVGSRFLLRRPCQGGGSQEKQSCARSYQTQRRREDLHASHPLLSTRSGFCLHQLIGKLRLALPNCACRSWPAARWHGLPPAP